MFLGIKRSLKRRDREAPAQHLELGKRGELLAVEYLTEYEGYDVVATNFLLPLGRGLRGQKMTAEIDVIAYEEEVLTFIEVKTRTTAGVAAPDRAVDLRKQRQIARAARRYRQLMRVYEEPYRYDVVTVLETEEGDKVELFRGYFDDRIFQRSRYYRMMLDT